MEMLAAIDSAPRSGHPRVVEPGSAESLQVRADVLRWRLLDRTDAANHARPLGAELKRTTIINILKDPVHMEYDKENLKPLIRVKQLCKNVLED